MPDARRLLDQGFERALQEAATLDQQRVAPDADFALFPDPLPSNVEIVQACAGYYGQHQVVIDAALESALKFLRSPNGVAHVKALEASFESSEPNPLSVALASRILHSEEFSFTSSPDGIQGLEGIGVGVSVGAAIPQAGVFAGADIVFEKDDIIFRAWAGANGKGAASASAGLELSFFTNTPTTGVIKGSLVDVYVPYEDLPILFFVRIMLIQQQVIVGGPFIACGLSIQLPLGIDWTPEVPVTSVFAAYQRTGKPKPQFALTISPNQIVSKAPPVNLAVRLTNTSTQDVTLNKGAQITISMPSYFQPTDVGNMKIDGLPGWTLSYSGNKLILTMTTATWTWKNQATIPGASGFNITNVATAQLPSSGSFQIGDVSLILAYGTKIPVVKNAELDLVAKIAKGTITAWNIDFGPPPPPPQKPDFSLVSGQPSEGTNVSITSAPDSKFQQLTQLYQESTGFTWMLGYVFDPDPRFAAAWFRTNAVRTKNTFFEGEAIAQSDTSSCFYKATKGNFPEIIIKVTLPHKAG